MARHRIDQILSRHGYCSRSEARGWVKAGRVFVAGERARDSGERVELTEVHVSPDGDAVVPAFGAEWRQVAREDHPAEGERPAYSFVTLERA